MQTSRRGGRRRNPKRIEFDRMLATGITPSEAAEKLGLSNAEKGTYTYLACKAGIVPKREYKAISLIASASRDYRVTFGAVRKPLMDESYDFVKWLIVNVPEGGTVAELLVAMAKDAYNEENEQ